MLVQSSEYLETHLLAVPNPLNKEFLKGYETVAPMVVPRSAFRLMADDEYTLYAVTSFKKHSLEFIHKCRERRWTPRDYKYVEGGREEEQKEMDRVGRDERKLWGEVLRMARTGWGDAVMVWIHVLALRVFVETVLRYGLPLEYVCGLVKVRADLRDTPLSLLSLPLCPKIAYPNLHTTNWDLRNLRRRRSSRRRPSRAWTRPIPTSVATPLAKIARAGQRTMIRPSLRCQAPSPTAAITRLMCIMSLSLSNAVHSLAGVVLRR